MIYMVEITMDASAEDEWNAWYADYIKILIAVPGISTAQRFIIPGSKPSRYMAMYTVSSGDVFESEIYKKSGGGGTASTRFRPAYLAWTRNLFESSGDAPAVAPDQLLAVSNREQRGEENYQWLKSVGLHKTTPWRGLAVIATADAGKFAQLKDGPTLYAPLIPQLKH